MASHVFYKFKSQKEPTKVAFEGTSITVWDLKREVIQNEKMGSGKDFDLALYNSDTGDEYKDDYIEIPRASIVIARRLPAIRSGHGTAQRYLASSDSSFASTSTSEGPRAWSGGHMSKRFDQPDVKSNTPPAVINAGSAGADEASRIAEMFATSSQAWQQTQEQLSSHNRVHFTPRGGARAGGGGPGRPGIQAPDKPPPAGYICFRCGSKGHWIQACPTNDKPEFNGRPRILRSTGIPRSFLSTVDAPDSEGRSGVMVTADGGFVVAKPDEASWARHRATTKNSSAIDLDALQPTDPELICPICSRLLRDAVATPCCSTVFCEECIQSHLTDNDFVCPECESKVRSLGQLTPAEDRRERAKAFVASMVEEKSKLEKLEEANEDGSTTSDGAKSPPPATVEGPPAPEQQRETSTEPSSTSASTSATADAKSSSSSLTSSTPPPTTANQTGEEGQVSKPASNPGRSGASPPVSKPPSPSSSRLPAGPHAQRPAPPSRLNGPSSAGNGFGMSMMGMNMMPGMNPQQMNPQMMMFNLQSIAANPTVHPQIREQAAQQIAALTPMFGMGVQMGMMNGGGFGGDGGRWQNGHGGGNGFGNRGAATANRGGGMKRQRPNDFVELRVGGEKEARRG